MTSPTHITTVLESIFRDLVGLVPEIQSGMRMARRYPRIQEAAQRNQLIQAGNMHLGGAIKVSGQTITTSWTGSPLFATTASVIARRILRVKLVLEESHLKYSTLGVAITERNLDLLRFRVLPSVDGCATNGLLPITRNGQKCGGIFCHAPGWLDSRLRDEHVPGDEANEGIPTDLEWV